MNTNILKTTVMVLLVITTIGCEKNETHKGIDSEINIRMVEVLDKSPRTLQMYFSTTKIYPCCNYPIDLSLKKSSNTFDISFKGVIETDMCLTALGPATATIDLGALSNGTYQLNFQNGSSWHSGQLVVSSDSYKVNLGSNSNFSFTNSLLNKIPENTIWGYVGYHKQETSALVQSFLDELLNLGANEKLYLPGDYREFEIDENGKIVQPGANSGYYFARSFVFQYSGDIAKVEQLVEQYARDYGTEYMYIGVYTDKGGQILSWMYK